MRRKALLHLRRVIGVQVDSEQRERLTRHGRRVPLLDGLYFVCKLAEKQARSADSADSTRRSALARVAPVNSPSQQPLTVTDDAFSEQRGRFLDEDEIDVGLGDLERSVPGVRSTLLRDGSCGDVDL